MVERHYPKSGVHPSKAVGRQSEMSGSEPGRHYPDKNPGVHFESDRSRITSMTLGNDGRIPAKDYSKSTHKPFESETKG